MGEDQVLAQKNLIRDSVPQTKGVFSNSIELDNFNSLFFHTFGVRRSIDDLDSESQPGSVSVKILTNPGSGLKEDVSRHQNYALRRIRQTKNQRIRSSSLD